MEDSIITSNRSATQRFDVWMNTSYLLGQELLATKSFEVIGIQVENCMEESFMKVTKLV